MASAAHENPLRVLLSDPHLRGGGQVTYLSRLARALKAAGHEPVIACRPGSILAEHAAQIGCACVDEFAYRGGLRPRMWRRDIGLMRAWIKENRPDILHVNGSQDHWTAAAANRMLGAPTCVVRTRHNTYEVKPNMPNRLLNRGWTDFQIIVCDWVRQRLARHPAFDPQRMTVVHNGVDADRFKPDAARRAEARRLFGYREDEIVCGIVARLVKAKGHPYLFEAIAALRESLPALRVLVLGQGALEDTLKRQAQELGIADVVTFAGFRDDMELCLHALDMGVQPSIDCDTSSFSLKEQMACGIPVISSDYGGLPEVVSDGVDGRVVPAGQSEPLAAAIRNYAQNPVLREQMGKAGRRRVLRDFSLEAFASGTLDAYRRALVVHRERTAS